MPGKMARSGSQTPLGREPSTLSGPPSFVSLRVATLSASRVAAKPGSARVEIVALAS
jgi:hypothetical protein